MKIGFVLIREQELVRGLRLNVSRLQRKLDGAARQHGYVTAKQRRLKEQLKIDRAYIDRLRGAVSYWVERSGPLPNSAHDSYALGLEIAAKFDSDGKKRADADLSPDPEKAQSEC